MARNFIERISDAVTQLREPLPTKMLGDIETKAVEARPDFGRGYSAPYLDSSYSRWWDYSKSVNYRHELGRLDNSSLVMAVCNWTGINLAEALPVVTKPDGKGVPQVELQHVASDLIRRPNPFHIWADYCLVGAFSWWMGNWYMKKVRDISGQVIELWYIPHFLIEPRWPSDGRTPQVPMEEVEISNTFLTHYQYNIPGRSPELIKKADMVHIKRGVNVDNPRVGTGVWDGVLQELYGHDAVNRFSAAILKNMGKVGYFLSPKDKQSGGPTETQARAMEEQFALKTTGENANRPMVSTGAMDVTRIGFSPEEMDLSELDKAPQAAIAGVTGIPAIVLQFPIGLEHGHYGAAYEQARQQGYENVIIPIQNHISEDLTWQVLPELDKSKGARLGFDISKVRVLQEDRDALYKRESDALRAGGITINQFLQSLGKEDLGKDGEIYYVPSLATPMTLEKLKQAATDMTPKPEPPPIDPASLAKFADLERWFDGLESQMKGFEVQK